MWFSCQNTKSGHTVCTLSIIKKLKFWLTWKENESDFLNSDESTEKKPFFCKKNFKNSGHKKKKVKLHLYQLLEGITVKFLL